MIITAVCDACHTALEGETTSVQLTSGEIVATLDRGVSLRSTRSPSIVNLCESCVAPVRQVLGQLLPREEQRHSARRGRVAARSPLAAAHPHRSGVQTFSRAADDRGATDRVPRTGRRLGMEAPLSARGAGGVHLQATETEPKTSSERAPRPDRRRLPLRWLRRGSDEGDASLELSLGRRELIGLRENGFNPAVFYAACPNLQLRDEESTHAPFVTAAHRCACAPDYVPDSVHQIVFCLTDSAHTTCPRFVTPAAPREVDDGALPAPAPRVAVQQRQRWPLAAFGAALVATAFAVVAIVALPPAGDRVPPRVAAAGESAAVTPGAAALVLQPPAPPAAPEAAQPLPSEPQFVSDRFVAPDADALFALYTAELVGHPPAPVVEHAPLSYVIEPGDSLLGIAASFEVDVDALLEANALSLDDPIFAGEVLRIPVSGPA